MLQRMKLSREGMESYFEGFSCVVDKITDSSRRLNA